MPDAPQDHSFAALSDMVVALVAELEARVSLDPETRGLVLTSIVIAANNGREIGAREMNAQMIQMGVDVEVNFVPGEQPPKTLAQALGEEPGPPPIPPA